MATVLEKRLLLYFTEIGSKIQIRHLHHCPRQTCRGHAAVNDTLPFSMNFCFRSSSELQGEVDPTRQIAAFQTDLFYNQTLVMTYSCGNLIVSYLK